MEVSLTIHCCFLTVAVKRNQIGFTTDLMRSLKLRNDLYMGFYRGSHRLTSFYLRSKSQKLVLGPVSVFGISHASTVCSCPPRLRTYQSSIRVPSYSLSCPLLCYLCYMEHAVKEQNQKIEAKTVGIARKMTCTECPNMCAYSSVLCTEHGGKQ